LTIKRIQIHFFTSIISLLLIYAGCVVAAPQTSAPAPARAAGAGGAAAASFELAAGPPMGAFRQMSGLQPPSSPPTKNLLPRRPLTVTLSGGDGRSSRNLIAWRQEVIDGAIDRARRNATIVVRSADGREIERFNLTNAYPIKYTNSSLRTSASPADVESVELVYESISQEK
jgi:hypothetical protein